MKYSYSTCATIKTKYLVNRGIYEALCYEDFWIFSYGYILLSTLETLLTNNLYPEWLKKRFNGKNVIWQPGSPTRIQEPLYTLISINLAWVHYNIVLIVTWTNYKNLKVCELGLRLLRLLTNSTTLRLTPF